MRNLTRRDRSDRIRHIRYARYRKGFAVLSTVIVFITFFSQTVPAATDSAISYCGIEEYRHTDDCYEEGTLMCGLEEHMHDLNCYSDQSADLEDVEDAVGFADEPAENGLSEEDEWEVSAEETTQEPAAEETGQEAESDLIDKAELSDESEL